jgi:hypothetical protein
MIRRRALFVSVDATDSVQFWRTVAKDGKIKKEDPLWTKQKFEQSYKGLQDIRNKHTKLRPRLTLSDESKTQLFSNYLNAPTVTGLVGVRSGFAAGNFVPTR